ncbi:MAG: IPT/TIG domain-containing protein, partial [Pseudomonadota bacterium]
MKAVKSLVLVSLFFLSFLAVGQAQAVEVIRNGGFDTGLKEWNLNPDVGAYWNPWIAGYVNLHPNIFGFTGAVIYQNLNVTQIAGVQFNLSAALLKQWDQTGKTVAVYVNYVDNVGIAHRVMIVNPDNSETDVSDVPPATPVPTMLYASYTFPVDARKLYKIEIAKVDMGSFYAGSVSFTADDVVAGPIPSVTGITPESGNYGTQVTVSGSNFGNSGQLYIGKSLVTTNSWNDTTITATVLEPTPSGKIVVRSDYSDSNPTPGFEVTSPYFTIRLVKKELTVIQGQSADFTVLASFFNGYSTANGITLFVAELGNNYTLTPSTFKKPCGINLSVDTSGMNPGTYQLTLQSSEDSSFARFAFFTINVITVNQIRFFEYDTQDPPQKAYLGSKTLTGPGQFGEQSGVSCEVTTSDGKVMANDAAGVVITSSNTNVVGAYLRYWGYDLFALVNGTANLIATAPDGTVAVLPVTVTGSPVTAFSLFPSHVSNAATETIHFHLDTNRAMSGLYRGADMSGFMDINPDFYEWPVLSNGGQSMDMDFILADPPAGLGLIEVSMGEYSGSAVVTLPLTTYNDPAYSGLSFVARPVDPSVMIMDALDIEFYTPDNLDTPAFTKTAWSMGLGQGKTVEVGGVTPGTYKIRFTSGWGGAGFLPQWWPSADDGVTAQALNFAAGQMVENVFFFARPAPVISVSGMVAFGTEDFPAQAVEGARVEVDGNPGLSTYTDSQGDFFLPGVPSGSSFSLLITKDGYVPVYSANFTLNSNYTIPMPYSLVPDGTLENWLLTPGTGMVMGLVAGPDGFLAGATVTAENAYDPGTTYPVGYLQENGLWGGTATTSKGVFAVMDLPPYTTVKLAAQKEFWTFTEEGSQITARAGTLSETGFFGAYLPPDAEALASLDSAITALNAKDLDGFMAFVSPDYLDGGETYAMFRAEISDLISAPGFTPLTYTVTQSTMDGDLVLVGLLWGNNEADTLIFREEGGVWKLYGNQFLFNVMANSGFQAASDQPTIYWTQMRVDDPGDLVTSVHVDGLGLPPGGGELNHDAEGHSWISWAATPDQTELRADFGRVKPDLPLVYTFTIQYTDNGAQEEVRDAQVTRFMDDAWAQNVSPAAGASGADPLVISWDALPGYQFGVEIWDSQGFIWEKRDLSQGSATYDGPALAPGFYWHLVMFSDQDGNYSMRTTPFLVPSLAGDVDNDGQVTVQDTVMGLPILTGGSQGGNFPALGDANQDGKVSQ